MRTPARTSQAIAGLGVGVLLVAGPVTATGAAPATGASGAVSAATAQAAPDPAPVLGRGDVGPAVLTWQQQVNAYRQEVGLDAIATDGIFGPVTENATRLFQADRNILVDGVVGPQTRGEMTSVLGDGPQTPVSDPAPAVPVLSIGSTGDAVASWQDLLNGWRASVGVTPIAVDGIYGPVTADATRQFQVEIGDIAVDGVFGPETAAAAAEIFGLDGPAQVV